ncbi:MAG TPA: hypothetical protein PK926_03190 [Spirochaetota bacterium]|nr:hypothetical protein [Spirochaetota bacterium]HPI88742.1 hypothetical protein [Spirochaetota bacterium]HPR47183.1 hypothetical protein [Spirochaetota bacterium]
MKSICFALILAGVFFLNPLDSSAQCRSVDYSGSKLVEKTDDREVYSKPDGTTIIKYADRDEARCPDGTTVIQYKDGSRLVEKPGGERLMFMPDGTVTVTGKDGEKKVSLKGRTLYGLEIKEENKILRRRGCTVELVYSSEFSDDVMDANMKSLFAELAREIDRWLYAKTPPRESIRVIMSNCRFCVVGYCGKKNVMGLEVIGRGAGWERSSSFSREDIINKKKHADMARKAVEEILGK